MGKTCHFVMVPWTGLGLYDGFRGNRWLKNRIKIFKQFVLPSLMNQTNKDFVLWFAWRYEEATNPVVKEFKDYMDFVGIPIVHTHAGIPFYDDKYPDEIAHTRLIDAIHGSMGELFNVMGEAETILMTIQPSDDVYRTSLVEDTQNFFKQTEYDVSGYKNGYVMDYLTGRLKEWNPATTPPFYTIRFTRDIFTDPMKHVKFIGPYKSHEFVKDFLKCKYLEERGFIVGTHSENISTVFNHPFAGQEFMSYNKQEILCKFFLGNVENLKIRISLRKWLMRKLPHGWQRKLRYWFGEKGFSRIYNFLRA